MAISEKSILNLAQQAGFGIQKSETSPPKPDDLGRYLLFDLEDHCSVLGHNYDAELSDIALFLSNTPHYCVFHWAGSYRVASSETPDQHEPYATEQEGIEAARAMSVQQGLDPATVRTIRDMNGRELQGYLR